MFQFNACLVHNSGTSKSLVMNLIDLAESFPIMTSASSTKLGVNFLREWSKLVCEQPYFRDHIYTRSTLFKFSALYLFWYPNILKCDTGNPVRIPRNTLCHLQISGRVYCVLTTNESTFMYSWQKQKTNFEYAWIIMWWDFPITYTRPLFDNTSHISSRKARCPGRRQLCRQPSQARLGRWIVTGHLERHKIRPVK